MIDALEAQDSDRVTKANDLLSDAEDIYKKYEAELEKLKKNMMLLRKSKYFYNSACRLVGCVIKEEEYDLDKMVA